MLLLFGFPNSHSGSQGGLVVGVGLVAGIVAGIVSYFGLCFCSVSVSFADSHRCASLSYFGVF